MEQKVRVYKILVTLNLNKGWDISKVSYDCGETDKTYVATGQKFIKSDILKIYPVSELSDCIYSKTICLESQIDEAIKLNKQNIETFVSNKIRHYNDYKSSTAINATH